MNPSTPPSNYLDQIAPVTPKKPVFSLNIRSVLILGVLAIIVVIILSNVSSAVANSQKKSWMQLSARLDATQEIVDSSASVIKNSQLKTANSDLKLALANTKRELDSFLKDRNITSKNMSKDILSQESSQATLDRLEDGRLNAKYDSTYTREMAYQLSSLLTLLQQMYNSAGSQSTKTFLENAYNSIEPIQKKVAAFSASNE